MGFGTGLLLDLAVGGTMGVSSLVLTAVGYAVGRYREVRDPAHGLMPIPVGAAATLGWGATFAAVSFMLDVGASVSPVIFREMLVTSAIGGVLAIPVFWALPQDPAALAGDRPVRAAPPPRAPARGGPARPPGPGDLDVYLDSDNRRQLTPQLALRVAIIGGVALVAFGLVFFRLWYLQVLSGDRYKAEASDNRVREIKVQAPRGEIVDREGRVLVDNRTGLAVRVTPKELPADPAERQDVYRRLGEVLDMKASRVERTVERQLKALPYSPATVKEQVSQPIVLYLFENQEDFPGVTVEQVFLRQYPHKEVGAHLFGTVRRDDQGAAAPGPLPRRGAGRPGGPVGRGVPVRPLPARAQRRQPGGGGRHGRPPADARGAASRPGPPAAPVGGPRRAARGPGGARAARRAPSR